MFNALRTLRLTLRGLTKLPEPRLVALGISVGLAVGMVPKGNLLAVLLGVLLCGLRLSLIAGIGTAVFVSYVAHHADPLFDWLGGLLLESAALRPMWVAVSKLPFADWTHFNNTVTLGSFLMGSALIYPVYRLIRGPLERLLPPVTTWVKKSVVMKVWGRFELAGRLGGPVEAG